MEGSLATFFYSNDYFGSPQIILSKDYQGRSRETSIFKLPLEDSRLLWLLLSWINKNLLSLRTGKSVRRRGVESCCNGIGCCRARGAREKMKI